MLIGLTGGIGSGKSAAAEHFQTLGIDVVDADLASRAVVEAGQPALAEIAEHFGADILDDHGRRQGRASGGWRGKGEPWR